MLRDPVVRYRPGPSPAQVERDIKKRFDANMREAKRLREEDEAAERERAKQREAVRKAAVDAAEAQLKETMRQRFLMTPGSTNAQFERAWPAMLRQIQIEQTLGGHTLHEEYAAMRRSSPASLPE